MDQVDAETFICGTGTVLHPSARIGGPDGGRATRVEIGDQCYIGEGVQIRCNDFSLGDYGRIHHQVTVHGSQPCRIGHNAWVGQFSIIDSTGGCEIGDNCGIGAQSQLWSHIKYGDTLEGCRFNQAKPLKIGKDVWFVGHCIVSPIVAGDKAVVLVGSVVTRDLRPNHVYAGSPAVDITSKIGAPFSDVPLAERRSRLQMLLELSGVDAKTIRIANQTTDVSDDCSSWFFLDSRTYTKRRTKEEVAFMEFLLPEKAKFTPVELSGS